MKLSESNSSVFERERGRLCIWQRRASAIGNIARRRRGKNREERAELERSHEIRIPRKGAFAIRERAGDRGMMTTINRIVVRIASIDLASIAIPCTLMRLYNYVSYNTMSLPDCIVALLHTRYPPETRCDRTARDNNKPYYRICIDPGSRLRWATLIVYLVVTTFPPPGSR